MPGSDPTQAQPPYPSGQGQSKGGKMLGNDWRTGALAKIRFDPPTGPIYAVGVEKGNVSVIGPAWARLLLRLPLPPSFTGYVGRGLFRFLLTMQGLGAFALITLGVMITRFGDARQVIRPRMLQELSRAGLRLLPMFLFISAALGLLVIGQTVSWLTR